MSRIFRDRIDADEFMKIARGKARRDLKRYISQGRLVIPRDNKSGFFAIPISWIEIPKFRFNQEQDSATGVGKGKGEAGDDLGPADTDKEDSGEGSKVPGGEGHGPGIEIEMPLEEFRELFQEELHLPNIKPKGDRSIFEERERYSSISKKGSPSLVHRSRTFKEALKHSMVSKNFNPDDPKHRKIMITPDDFRYKSTEFVLEPKNNAVCFWERDGSGSMGDEEIRVVNQLVSLCEFWLSCFYDRVENVYIIHDDEAHEVSREKFFTLTYGGGTKCSTVLVKQIEITETRYPVSEWNIYSTYLSDGMNFTNDNDEFISLLSTKILPVINQFNYGEIDLFRTWWGYYDKGTNRFSNPGTIGSLLEPISKVVDNLALTEIKMGDEDAIISAIREFFGKGN